MRRSELKETIGEIRKHSRQLVRELDVVKGVYLGTGYTFTQCHVLFEISAHGKLGLLELAENLLLDKSNTSRTVKKLVELGLVKSERTEADSRQKLFSLTPKGESALAKTVGLADEQVESAISVLSESEQSVVIHGLQLYGDALRKSRLQAPYSFRKIRRADNSHISRIMGDVMSEFGVCGDGVTRDDGFTNDDKEGMDFFARYRGKDAAYVVVTREEKIVGGGGIAPLGDAAPAVCELHDLCLVSPSRGFGLGRRLLEHLIDEAASLGFTGCYIATLNKMEAANALIRKLGFEARKKPLVKNVRSAWDTHYLLQW